MPLQKPPMQPPTANTATVKAHSELSVLGSMALPVRSTVVSLMNERMTAAGELITPVL